MKKICLIFVLKIRFLSFEDWRKRVVTLFAPEVVFTRKLEFLRKQPKRLSVSLFLVSGKKRRGEFWIYFNTINLFEFLFSTVCSFITSLRSRFLRVNTICTIGFWVVYYCIHFHCYSCRLFRIPNWYSFVRTSQIMSNYSFFFFFEFR